jgi:hypothetical protein
MKQAYVYHINPDGGNNGPLVIMVKLGCVWYATVYNQYCVGQQNAKPYDIMAWVSNPQPAMLYYAARDHMCKLCIHYKNYTIN